MQRDHSAPRHAPGDDGARDQATDAVGDQATFGARDQATNAVGDQATNAIGDQAGFSDLFEVLPEVAAQLGRGGPVVALESAVLTHGLPYPLSLSVAGQVEDAVREEGAIPATVAVLRGRVHVGLAPDGLVAVATAESARKIGLRDLPVAMARGETGGTTVSATLGIAHRVGVPVFSTGGIGGVHRHEPADVSEDIGALGRTPVTVVCSGPKTLLDLPATAERLESVGVPVLGYRCDDMPAFYVGESGCAVTQRVESVAEVARIVQARDALAARNAVLLAVPIPSRHAMALDEVERAAARATREAWSLGVRGSEVTPQVLARMAELSGGRTLDANRALLVNNARVAAGLACELASA